MFIVQVIHLESLLKSHKSNLMCILINLNNNTYCNITCTISNTIFNILLKVTFSNTAHKHATEAILSRLYSWLSSKGICVVSLPEVGKYPASCCILNEAVSTKQHRERNTESHEVFITPWLKWPGTGSSGCCKSLCG